MFKYPTRDIYHPDAVRQQNDAVNAVLNFVSQPLELAKDAGETSDFAYFIGRTLQPAIEGLARWRPELASLTFTVDSEGTSTDFRRYTHHGACALWVAGNYGRHAVFGIHPPTARTVRNDLLIQKHEPGEPWAVSISQMQRTKPGAEREEVGVMSGASLCMRSADPTQDIYDYLYGYGRIAGTDTEYEHYVLSGVLESVRTPQEPFDDLPAVRKVAGEQAARVYETYGPSGLLQLRMHQALGEICSDLRLKLPSGKN